MVDPAAFPLGPVVGRVGLRRQPGEPDAVLGGGGRRRFIPGERGDGLLGQLANLLELPLGRLVNLARRPELSRQADDPRGAYAAPGNSAARVWHGDRLTALCVLTSGTMVKDESGISSTRWYLARTPNGTEGWLPGVRTRNSAEVRHCSDSEVP